MLLAVHYQVMEHVGSLESTQEARVALSYCLGQLLHFFHALQTSHMLQDSIVQAKAWTNSQIVCEVIDMITQYLQQILGYIFMSLFSNRSQMGSKCGNKKGLQWSYTEHMQANMVLKRN